MCMSLVKLNSDQLQHNGRFWPEICKLAQPDTKMLEPFLTHQMVAATARL